MSSVYIICDPTLPGDYDFFGLKFKFLPRYVGKTRQSVSIRIRAHLRAARSSDLSDPKERFLKWLFWWQNLKPEVQIYESGLEESAALELERDLIYVIGRRDLKEGPLLNKSNGGEGFAGQRSKRSSKKIVRAWRRTVEAMSDDRITEWREKLSESAKQHRATVGFSELSRRGKKAIKTLGSAGMARRTKKIQQTYWRKAIESHTELLLGLGIDFDPATYRGGRHAATYSCARHGQFKRIPETVRLSVLAGNSPCSMCNKENGNAKKRKA